MNHEEEQRLIRRVLGGDAEAFAPLVECYGRPIFSLVYGIVGRREESEELTQDIFLKAYTRLVTYGGRSRFSTWLYRIATNTAFSAARKKKHDTINIEDNAYGDIPDELLDEALDNDSEEQLQRLSEAIDRLDAEERALITLYHMNERPIEEVATIMGLTQSNVKTKLYRTRKKLYLLLNDRKL